MAKAGTAYHCCVPLCTNDSRYDPKKELSFHRFPTDKNLKKLWLIKIRRDIGPKFKVSLIFMLQSSDAGRVTTLVSLVYKKKKKKKNEELTACL